MDQSRGLTRYRAADAVYVLYHCYNSWETLLIGFWTNMKLTSEFIPFFVCFFLCFFGYTDYANSSEFTARNLL